MDEREWLAEQFEQNREHLRGVAFRMLGSLGEADDAVQEAWLRLNRTGAQGIENLGGWLTTVVAHVSLDMLRSRKSRREDSLDAQPTEPQPATPPASAKRTDPEREAILADSVGLALMVVLDRLNPPERLAFVLHDLFGVSFNEIGSIVGRSATATRQLASRARRRVQGAAAPPRTKLSEQRRVVDAFLTALRAGDFEGLVSVLDPDVSVHIDAVAQVPGMPLDQRGAELWARQAITSARGAVFARPALVDGAVGVVIAPRGRLFRAINFTIVDGKITHIDFVADPERLQALNLAVLED